MPTEFAFRLSTYLTLALACAGLGYAEWDFLPEVSILSAVVVLFLAVLFRAEGHYQLTLKAANWVGLVIAALTAGWLAYLFANQNSLIYTFPWPASLLPCLGPLLLVLIPAKLSRPKHVGDWWAMQGLGLVTIGLASSMAEDEVFGVLLVMYAVTAVSSLTLFYYRRSAGTLPPAPNSDPGPPPVVIASGWAAGVGSPGRAAVRRAVGWLGVAIIVSLPLFFLTPRSQVPRWQFTRSHLETGYGSDQMIDLNRTGDLRVNREVAYEVRVTYADGRPKEDLSPYQRWRGSGYHVYENGRWGRNTLGTLVARTIVQLPIRNALSEPSIPDYGPDRFELSYTPKLRHAEPVVADPVVWELGKSPPIWSQVGDEARPWRHLPDGSFQSIARGDSTPPPHRQFTRPAPMSPEDQDLSPPFELAYLFAVGQNDTGTLLSTYVSVRLPRIRQFAIELLERLALTDPVLKVALDRTDTRVSRRLVPEDFEAVSRAFSRHLAESGEYTYTTTLRRMDRTLDPVEEFLTRTKAGHCERYAAALTLMLRSIGVPAVYVLGYKGCDYDGNGVYLIRQEHAHAWVEVMVPRKAPPGYPFRAQPTPEVWHWMSVDPTPAGDADSSDEGVGSWLDDARATWAAFFTDFIIGYNPERRQRAVNAAGEWLGLWWWVLAAVPVAILFFVFSGFVIQDVRAPAAQRRPWFVRLARFFGHRPGPTQSGLAWYDDLARLLAEKVSPPQEGATPRESASAAADVLRGRSATASVADVPGEVTRAFYQARYGDRPPTADELAALTAALERLRSALNGSYSRP